jgi:S1-C subfamily serine protease
MKTYRFLVPAIAAMLFAGQAIAQSDEEERLRAAEERELQVEQRLREAEEKMEEAARTIAELTEERLPRTMGIEREFFTVDPKPRLGVTIGSEKETGPVEGVSIMGVTPGAAADEAGLRAGDIITSINNESLSADNPETAMQRLLDFMKGVEEGDTLAVEYLRGGNVGKVDVKPTVVAGNRFIWKGKGFDMPPMPDVHMAPNIIRELKHSFAFGFGPNSWGDMELVELSEGLGSYFGTNEGLLVVSAPESNTLQLKDGDVIQSIDGRKPDGVGHAMRILGSYEPGEKLELQIMRNKKREKLQIEIPEDPQTGMLLEFLGDEAMARPVIAIAPRAPLEIITEDERT